LLTLLIGGSVLLELKIKGLALIDELHINFKKGLNIISGETGAGKSIIINSLNLILGGRIPPDLLRSGYNVGNAEAVFIIPPNNIINQLLNESGIDLDGDSLIIKRQISKNGRSRAWINQCNVTLTTLNHITRHLVDISSQREHNYLLKKENHLKVINTPKINKLVQRYQQDYFKWKEINKNLESLIRSEEENQRKLDYFLFQKDEIDKAHLNLKEDQELNETRNRLLHAEELYKVFAEAEENLYSSNESALTYFTKVQNDLKPYKTIDSRTINLYQMIEEISVQLEDFISEARTYYKSIETDPALLQEVEERFSLLLDLKNKYGDSIEAILNYRKGLDNQIDNISNTDEKIMSLKKEKDSLEKKLLSQAEVISKERKAWEIILSKHIETELKGLGMEHTSFVIQVANLNDNQLPKIGNTYINEWGKDNVEFFISPNKGENLLPLTSIVSGGELSRIILSIKTSLARTEDLHVFIFDEIDSGIGGSIAKAVGCKLANLANKHQILCITHLGQVACFANNHLLVEKFIEKGRTITSIKHLSKTKEQIKELARMISGSNITKKALELATEMKKST